MKVLALRADWGACSLYRIEQPARCVNEAGLGAHVEVTNGLDVDAYRLEDGSTRVRAVSGVDDVDVVILQRPVDHVWCQVIPLLQGRGIAVVVEIDDDLDAVSVRNVAHRHGDPARSPWSNRKWLRRACDLADLVTVTTPALAARYAGHGRYAVLPNYVSRSVTALHPMRERPGSAPVRVGWTGTLRTHPDDLAVTGRGVAQAVREHGAAVRVVGDGEGVRRALGLAASVDLRDTGWLPLASYHQRVVDEIDVGVVPLLASAFNDAKSWLKLVEFSALGIPAVASPTVDNVRAYRLYGLGRLAGDARTWRAEVGALLADPERAREVGAAARARVWSDLLAEDHADEWVTAWRRALTERTPTRPNVKP